VIGVILGLAVIAAVAAGGFRRWQRRRPPAGDPAQPCIGRFRIPLRRDRRAAGRTNLPLWRSAAERW